jgi:hypothetical protein
MECSCKKKKMKKDAHQKVVKRLKEDISTDKREAKSDRAAGKKMGKKAKEAVRTEGKKRSDLKFDKVLREYTTGKLHSGSKTGPEVTSPKQAVAIAYSEARRGYKKKKK